MVDLEFIKELSVATPSKIIMVVIDGLGGLPGTSGKTELETAKTPNLDALAALGVCGLSDPVSPGITVGSAPGHLALFGYDPRRFSIGRGVLEALGIDFDLQDGDIAARGNFCTVDENGIITDRRVGRMATEKNAGLCHLLDGLTIDGTRIIARPVKDHRLVIVLRGEGLSDELTDSDPQKVGLKPKPVEARCDAAKRTAGIVNAFLSRAGAILAEHHPANMILLRGFSKKPALPTMTEVYKLNPAAIAAYPMYRGLAKTVGMKVLKTGITIEDEICTLKQAYEEHDFIYLHIKETDSAGEDGDFGRKVAALEHIDKLLPDITGLAPDVIVVTGDHSTPAMLKGHGWHPVPVLISSPWCHPDDVKEFSESACIHGGLGRIMAVDIMPLAMANALKLAKFGA